jgi:hypothetical protein
VLLGLAIEVATRSTPPIPKALWITTSSPQNIFVTKRGMPRFLTLDWRKLGHRWTNRWWAAGTLKEATAGVSVEFLTSPGTAYRKVIYWKVLQDEMSPS